jgi:hypothetical protein
MPLPVHIRCETCAFYSPERAPKPTKGQCRADPPKFVETPEGPRARWPILHPREWCGAHSTLEQRDGPHQ